MVHFFSQGGYSDPLYFIEEKDETLEKVSNLWQVGTDVGELWEVGTDVGEAGP